MLRLERLLDTICLAVSSLRPRDKYAPLSICVAFRSTLLEVAKVDNGLYKSPKSGGASIGLKVVVQGRELREPTGVSWLYSEYQNITVSAHFVSSWSFV